MIYLGGGPFDLLGSVAALVVWKCFPRLRITTEKIFVAFFRRKSDDEGVKNDNETKKNERNENYSSD